MMFKLKFTHTIISIVVIVCYAPYIIDFIKSIVNSGISNLFTVDEKYIGIIIASFLPFTINKILCSILSMISFVVQYLFLDHIVITNTDDDSKGVYEWVAYYIIKKRETGMVWTSNVSIETANTSKKMWFNSELNDNMTQTRLLPSSWGILFDEGKIIIIHIDHKVTNIKYEHRGFSAGKHINLYIPLRFLYGKDYWKRFVNKIKVFYNDNMIKNQCIYKHSRGKWRQPIITTRTNLHDGTIVLTSQMKKVVDGIDKFLKPSTYADYKNKGFDYCRKILVYGPPGSGKSKLIVNIAGEKNLPLYYVNCNKLTKEKTLRDMFDCVRHCIIVIEEIDKCIEYIEHKNSNNIPNDDITNGENINKYNKNLPPVTEWHEVLDKILGDKIIVYMTTNNYNVLQKINHGSIIRAGRVDQIVHLGTVSKDYINQLLNKYFNTNKTYFDKEIPEATKLTPADIINIIRENDNIDSIREEIITKNNLLAN